MEPLRLEAQTGGSPWRGLLFALSLVVVVFGVGVAMAKRELLLLLLSCVGVALFVFLMRSEPRATYAEYVRVDDSGFTFTHSPGTTGRVSRYAWAEIAAVNVVQDPPGISLSTRRPELGGVAIFFGMPDSHAKLVVQKIKKNIDGANAA